VIEFAVVIGSYLLGAIPVGLVLSKLKGVDLRQFGSGKTGSTNVLRTIGKKYAVLALIGDILKGVIAVLIARYTLHSPFWEVAAGFAAVIGHNWPVYIKFQGGRGVATATGALLPLAPLASISAIVVFFIIAALTRYASLGSIMGALTAIVVMAVLLTLGRTHTEYLIYTVAAAAMIIGIHYDNIKRLLSGTESKIGDKGAQI